MLEAGSIRRRGSEGEILLLNSWLSAGCDLQLDILPTIRDVALRKTDGPANGLKYFDNAVRRAHADRIAGKRPAPFAEPTAEEIAEAAAHQRRIARAKAAAEAEYASLDAAPAAQNREVLP